MSPRRGPCGSPVSSRSGTEEATSGLQRIYEGARTYYAAHGELPGTAGDWRPAQGTCCGNPEDRCVPDPGDWAGHPWVDLMFSVETPHYFSYLFTSESFPARFTAVASADLDCDSSFSLFEVYGVLGADGSFPPFDLAEKYIENEYE